MATTAYLFDMEPFTMDCRRPRPKPLTPGTKAALHRLRQTLDAIPREEWEARRRRYEALTRSLVP